MNLIEDKKTIVDRGEKLVPVLTKLINDSVPPQCRQFMSTEVKNKISMTTKWLHSLMLGSDGESKTLCNMLITKGLMWSQ